MSSTFILTGQVHLLLAMEMVAVTAHAFSMDWIAMYWIAVDWIALLVLLVVHQLLLDQHLHLMVALLILIREKVVLLDWLVLWRNYFSVVPLHELRWMLWFLPFLHGGSLFGGSRVLSGAGLELVWILGLSFTGRFEAIHYVWIRRLVAIFLQKSQSKR